MAERGLPDQSVSVVLVRSLAAVFDLLAARPTSQARAPAAAAAVASPWPILRRHARSILVAALCALAVLGSFDWAIFGSGFFESHVPFSNPDSPAAKQLLIKRLDDVRVLYVGDSTVLTDIAPRVAAESCQCGSGFNSGFSAATPWLIAIATEDLLHFAHPDIVVLGVSPWALDESLRFEDSGRVHEVLTWSQLAERGVTVDPRDRLQSLIESVWSLYRQRALIKDAFSSFLPRQRYDDSERGFFVPPGEARATAQLEAGVERMKAGISTRPSLTSPGARELSRLVDELRLAGMTVFISAPPLHPAGLQSAAAYLAEADAVRATLARTSGAALLDCRDAVGPDDFRDLDHLSIAGAAKFSRCVGERLRGS